MSPGVGGDGIGMCLELLGALKALDVGAQDYKGRRASPPSHMRLPRGKCGAGGGFGVTR